MTRILATGDWHAGVGTLDLADQETVWHRIVDLALERECDLVLHAGDLYHGPLVTMEQIAAVRRVFNRLREARVPLLMIRGNSVHDLATRPVDALDLFRDYAGITVSSRPEVHYLAGVAVCTLPWASPAGLIAQANGTVDRDRVNEQAARMLVGIARDLLEAESIYQEGTPTILLAHWSISGAALPNGLDVESVPGMATLEWADLEALGYDLVVAGHIHKKQSLNEMFDATPGFYVGSPQQLRHGEQGEHGVWVVDFEAGDVSWDFVAIESRQFVTHDVDPELLAQPLLWPNVGDGDIIRVRFSATEDQARRIDHAAIRAALLEAGAYRVTFEPTIIRAARARVEAVTEDLSPLDALALYAAENEIELGMAARMSERLREWMTA